jgi:hypothetical protein
LLLLCFFLRRLHQLGLARQAVRRFPRSGAALFDRVA